MTANSPCPAESTPRRGFGMARLVLRAVEGAVDATRQAARTVNEALMKRRPATARQPAPRKVAGRASLRHPVVQRWLTVPLSLWRRIAADEVDAWLARQT